MGLFEKKALACFRPNTACSFVVFSNTLVNSSSVRPFVSGTILLMVSRPYFFKLLFLELCKLLQEDDDLASYAPAGVPRKCSSFMECFDKTGPGNRDEKIEEPVDSCGNSHSYSTR